MSTIQNGNQIPLNQNSGTLPQLDGAMGDWYQPMTFTKVAKMISGIFTVEETPSDFTFRGVWQPQTAQQLSMKPEGQRVWKWFTVHAQIGVPLAPDDVINYLGTQYRVMAKSDYSIYGYDQYELVNDFTGSGP